MGLVDAYCKIKIEWDEKELVFNLQVLQHEGSNTIIDMIVNEAKIHLLCKTHIVKSTKGDIIHLNILHRR
jgi:hypothetical protein